MTETPLSFSGLAEATMHLEETTGYLLYVHGF